MGEERKKPQPITGWFADFAAQQFVGLFLTQFAYLQKGQRHVLQKITDKFTSTVQSVRTIEAELRKPLVWGLQPAEQLDLVLRHYANTSEPVKPGGFYAKVFGVGELINGQPHTRERDLSIMFSYMVVKSDRMSQAQADEAVPLILRTFADPEQLIFVWNGKGDYETERTQWREQLDEKVRREVSLSSSRGASLRKTQDTLDRKTQEMKRKQREILQKQDQMQDDPLSRDTLQLKVDLLEAAVEKLANEVPELEVKAMQEMKAFAYFTEALGVIVRSIETVMRETIMHRELETMKGRIARYQKLFNQLIMPFVDGLDNMQHAQFQARAAYFDRPTDEQSSVKLVDEFVLAPNDSSDDSSDDSSAGQDDEDVYVECDSDF